MDLLKKVNELVLGLVMLLAIGCGKEKDPNPGNSTAQQTCLLVKTKNQEYFGDEDREFVFHSNGQITKVTLLKNNQPIRSEAISYSTTGKITWIRSYMLANPPYMTSKTQFFYNSDSLINREVYYFSSIPEDSVSMTPVSECNYIYDAANRITKKTLYYFQSAAYGSYTNYTYAPNNILIEEVYEGSPVALTWRREIQYVPNSKAPGGNYAYFNLPPRSPLNSNEIRFGLLPISVQTTKFYPGTSQSPSTITWDYSYVYNAEGYPTEQIRLFSNQQPWSNFWIYNCR